MTRRAKKRVSTRGRKRSRKQASKQNFAIALQKLRRMKQVHRINALRMANNTFIRQFANHVHRLKHARLSPKLRARVQKQRNNLRHFVSKKTSVSSKRKMLTQRGGFLPLLMAALPALGSIIGGIVSRT